MLFQYLIVAFLVAKGFATKSRITNGVTALPHKYPYQVSVQWGFPPLIRYRHMCGGSIIDPSWILTAGHCITEIPKIGSLQVVAGKHDLTNIEPGQQERLVDRRVVYESYPGGASQHDIGLLKLKSPFNYTDHIQPIGLPKSGKQHTGDVIISGWGSISTNMTPEYPSKLQAVEVSVLDLDTCLATFQLVFPETQIFDTQICTGPVGGDRSPCSGDSGGALMQFDVDGKAEQVGIVSWGAAPCGNGAPSVFTRVSSYVDWIAATLDGSR
ncbi:trypsin-1 [Fopius arisanus]|uniref:Acrosin n=1 Tax=Fopius arisanus TaxID=64838 RepID=A0A0C9RRV3_9HYME|nr:PREDICTED: trypsin-1-like [Fopius arisanus]